jgi:hypothetical protein
VSVATFCVPQRWTACLHWVIVWMWAGKTTQQPHRLQNNKGFILPTRGWPHQRDVFRCFFSILTRFVCLCVQVQRRW